MKKSVLFFLWAVLYVLCALLGLMPPKSTGGTVLAVLLSILFFLPGGLLVYRGIRQNDRKLLKVLRLICALSLLLTLVMLVVSFFTVLASEAVGMAVHILLTLVSVPMICSGYWILSLFLWACLLMCTLLFPKRRK